MLSVRKEAQQKARTPDEVIKATGDLMQAEAAIVQANATARVAYAKLINVVGLQ